MAILFSSNVCERMKLHYQLKPLVGIPLLIPHQNFYKRVLRPIFPIHTFYSTESVLGIFKCNLKIPGLALSTFLIKKKG